MVVWLRVATRECLTEAIREHYRITREESHHLVAIKEQANVLPDVSSFTKLCRIIAYCCRFIKKCRKEALSESSLTISELEQAEIIVIKLVQKEVIAQKLTRGGRG